MIFGGYGNVCSWVIKVCNDIARYGLKCRVPNKFIVCQSLFVQENFIVVLVFNLR